MSPLLARLRGDLDFLASPIPDRPGLLLRDPFRYSDQVVVVPPLLGECLNCFDGAHTNLDLHHRLAHLTGRIDLGDVADAFARGLSDAGFLDDESFWSLRTQRHDQFSRAPVRDAAFSGGGYPADPAALSQTLATWIGSRTNGENVPVNHVTQPDRIVAIAAPHASPTGGVSTYGAAYRALGPNLRDRTFVILGTSHYGRPNRFGLCGKSFATPLGKATTDGALYDALVRTAGDAIDPDDYCHAVEHSIEFQILFLQAVYGASVRILPILCGPFVCGPTSGARPEDDVGVARVLGALGDLQAQHGSRLFWVLGVDLAHVGRRYGDNLEAHAHQGAMQQVATRDRARLERVVDAQADGFWELTHENGADDLKWCGSAPLYAFMRTHPSARGRVLHYDQWNIDESSVVSFAALSFS